MHELRAAVLLSLLPRPFRYAAVARIREAFRSGALRPEAPVEAWVAAVRSPGHVGVGVAGLEAVADRAVARASRLGILPVPFTDPAYPPLLATLTDAPAVLWVLGDVAVLSQPAVAVVGSRAASRAGCLAARQLGAELAAVGVVVVSGLARGVDGEAHLGALTAGRTAAVLGCGLDRVYPAEHDALARRIAAGGAVVSEFAPGTPPRKHHFPLRNRLISGLSLAVVVVEAAERSGALITARTGLDQGREVMAMPGSVAGGRNRGAHALIRDGALLVESAADVLAAIHVWAPPVAGRLAPTAPDDPVLRVLTPGEVVDIDAVAAQSGLASPELLARIASLELDGWVERAPGGRIVRLARKW